MARVGCLVLLLAIGVLCIELYVYLVVADLLHRHFVQINGYLEPIIAIIVTSIIGVKVTQRALTQLPLALMGGGAGRLLVRALAGLLLAFPGLATDVLGLLLLIPGVDRLFGRLGDKVAASIVRQSMQKMFSGLGAKMPPGVPPGMGQFPFPGMKPDDRVGGGPKTYDTTAEKDEPKQ